MHRLIAALLMSSVLSACQTPSSNQATNPSSNSTQQLAPISDTVPTNNSATANESESANNSAPLNTEAPTDEPIKRAQKTGVVQNKKLTEISGLAASTRQSNLLWAINDSGNAAELFGFNQQGQHLGSWKVGVNNRDWEDMASTWINGESYLLIADIGDNLRVKNKYRVHIFAEPFLNNQASTQDANNTEPLRPIHTITYRYPDAAHNAESLTVDGSWIYILTKEPLLGSKPQASRLYRIPLVLSGSTDIVTADYVSQLAVPSSSLESSLIASLTGLDVSQPTAFDIHQDSQTAYVLTYRSVYRYQRAPNQSWAETFAQSRQKVHSHFLSQAEALAVDQKGIVWFTSENLPAPLWTLP